MLTAGRREGRTAGDQAQSKPSARLQPVRPPAGRSLGMRSTVCPRAHAQVAVRAGHIVGGARMRRKCEQGRFPICLEGSWQYGYST